MNRWQDIFPLTEKLTMKDIDDYLYRGAFSDAPSFFLDALRDRIEEIFAFRDKLYRKGGEG